MVWHLYNRMLVKHPYVTRSFVAAGMMGSGDIINQRVFEKTQLHEIARSSRFFVYGFAFHAPVLAQWFKVMDRIQFTSSRWTIGTRVALAQTVWGSFSITMFYTIMSLLEGHTFEEAKEKVVVGFWPTYLTGAITFLPTTLMLYSVIPLQHRTIFYYTVGLGWNVYLSSANHKTDDLIVESHLHPSQTTHLSNPSSILTGHRPRRTLDASSSS